MGIGFSGSDYLERINTYSMNILEINIDFIKSAIDEIYLYKDEIDIFD